MPPGGLADRVGRADQRGEKILHFAFAGVALPDAHALSRRSRIDVDPLFGRKLGHRVDLGHVDKVCAPVIRNPEGLRVGDAAPANVVVRLQQRIAALGSNERAGGRNARGARADDGHVDERRSGRLGGRKRR